MVPDVVIPPKFKMPKFEKYDGTKCPKNHLATYCHKMVGHAYNEELLVHMFYDSLIGTVAQWYVKLKNEQIRTWRDLARAFLGRYKYMLETAPDRLTLQNMKKELEENFMFVDTLPSPYYDMLVVNAFVEFEDLMYSVGRIEDGIKRGKILRSMFKQCPERKEGAKEDHT